MTGMNTRHNIGIYSLHSAHVDLESTSESELLRHDL